MLMAFFVGVLVISLDYSPRARLVPIPISVLGILLLGAQLVWQNLRSPDELHVDMLEFLTKRTGDPSAREDSGAEAEAAEKTETAQPSHFGREVFAFFKVALFVGLFLLLGPFPSVFIFTFAYFSLTRHYHWAKAMVVTTIFVAVTYLLFVEMLDIHIYYGVLEPLIHNY